MGQKATLYAVLPIQMLMCIGLWFLVRPSLDGGAAMPVLSSSSMSSEYGQFWPQNQDAKDHNAKIKASKLDPPTNPYLSPLFILRSMYVTDI